MTHVEIIIIILLGPDYVWNTHYEEGKEIKYLEYNNYCMYKCLRTKSSHAFLGADLLRIIVSSFSQCNISGMQL